MNYFGRMAAVDPVQVGNQFVEFYYRALDNADSNTLGQLYQDGSTLSFEGETFKGRQAIVGKLTGLGLPPGQVLRRRTSTGKLDDCRIWLVPFLSFATRCCFFLLFSLLLFLLLFQVFLSGV